MKYRIKEYDIEKAVRGLFKTQEDFEAKLNLEIEKQKHSVYRIYRIAIEPDLCVLNSNCVVEILKSDVDEVVEYDPRKWNPYPQVKPPKEGWYRVEHANKGAVIRRAMYWEGSNWLDLFLERCNPRFKPWEDANEVK